MSRQTNISVMGLYNWDNTIFDMMLIPENLDRTVVIENILAETAELEVIYPNPYVFKSLVGVWSHKQIDIWNRLYNTTQYEYNPIENYNRYETGSEDGENVTAHSGTDSNTETIAHTGTNSNTKANTLGGNDRVVSTSTDGGSETENITNHFETEGTDTTTGTKEVKEYVAGFDSVPSANDDGLVLKGKTNETGTSTTTTSREDDATAGKTTTFGKTNNTTEQTTYGKTENETDTLTFNDTITKNGGITHGESVTSTKEGQFENHAHGNIGVTTTQKLIREQREVEKFNLYDIIIEEFKERFCVMVY